MHIHRRFSFAAIIACALLAGCASNSDRTTLDDREKTSRLLDEERARREAYEQGYWDAQQQQRAAQRRPSVRRPTLPSGQTFGTAPVPLPDRLF